MYTSVTPGEHFKKSTYMSIIDLPRREFADRFADLRSRSGQLLLFSKPFRVDVDNVVQMELIEPQ